jgi:glycosyltransferase involved in cell wall biosynthesis/4-amino-4-deoxy-L-arabinose transferase-like glycosyltransferase
VPDPTISLIIPVFNGGADFRRCLMAIAASAVRPHELIVVDDGSQDGSAQWAREAGARLLRTKRPGSGPALARNLAAQHAAGDLLYFCDADVEIRPDTLAHIQRAFASDPGLTALFGSYDDAPGDPGFISQYKNLFHHYIHQHGAEDASTFWSGCGIIRRDVFLQHGGFSSRYQLPSIEDIELGYTLKKHGCRLRLDKALQVKHLKRWTLHTLLRSDIIARGIPWTRLILRERAFLNDLNLQTHNRVSVAAVYVGLLCAALALWQPILFLGSLLAVLLLLILNRPLYHFFAQKRGPLFALGVIPFHWLYYFYNGLSFGLGTLLYWREEIRDRRFETKSRASRFKSQLLITDYCLLFTIFLAAALRFHALGAQSLWLDELLEIELAGKGMSAILDRVLSFGAMPLDYFVTRAASQLGAQDFWLRVAPALWSVLTVAVMYRLVGQTWGRGAGLTAAGLLAVSRFHLRYAQETRPYALFGLLSLLSFYFLFRALNTNRPRHWVGYALSTAFSLLTHYFTLFVVIAQMLIGAVWVWANARRAAPTRALPTLVRFGLALMFVVGVLACTPYSRAVLGVGQVFAAGLLAPQSFTVDAELKPNQGNGPALDRAFFVNHFWLPFSGGGPSLPVVFWGLVVVGLMALAYRRRSQALMLGLWASVPIALTIAFLVHRGTFFATRYVTPSYLAILILAALGLVTLARAMSAFVKRPWGGAVSAVLVCVPLTLGFAQALDYYTEHKEDWRMTARFIDANFQPGDTVVSPLAGGVLFHYTQKADAGRQDDFSIPAVGAAPGRLWVVWNPYIGPAGEELKIWLAGQASVEYRVDDSLSVYVLNQPVAVTLAQIPSPETAWARTALGQQYERRDDAAQAETSFRHALALSTTPEFQINYADFLRRQGRSDDAVPYYFAALKQDPDSVGALAGLARIYLQRNLLDDAARALEWAARLAPDDYAVNYFLAQTYERAGRPADATIYRERARQLVPDLVEPP